jgi:abortive infection bacteriophage resistance protein
MSKYEKKFLNISEQVKLLKKRGLFFEDENRLRFYLKHINYYHLSAYFKTFQNNNENFKSGTGFEDVLNLYNFDKKLRLLLLDILERIEISFKSVLSHDITRYRDDLHWYLPEKNN